MTEVQKKVRDQQAAVEDAENAIREYRAKMRAMEEDT